RGRGTAPPAHHRDQLRHRARGLRHLRAYAAELCVRRLPPRPAEPAPRGLGGLLPGQGTRRPRRAARGGGVGFRAPTFNTPSPALPQLRWEREFVAVAPPLPRAAWGRVGEGVSTEQRPGMTPTPFDAA